MIVVALALLILASLGLWFALRRPGIDDGKRDPYVNYRPLLRTTDFGKLTVLRSLLDDSGIRHYSSQANVVHLGEAQLFVERDRLEHAEAILQRLDEAPVDDD